MQDPETPPCQLKDALAVREWARTVFPAEFEALPDPDDLETYILEKAETSTILKAIAFTSFDPSCRAAEWLWPGTGEITVLAFIQESSLMASPIRGEQIGGEFNLLTWLKDYGPTFLDAFASCSLDDRQCPTPVEIALEIEATIRYYLAAKGVIQALECDGQMFKWNFARACQRQHQKLLEEGDTPEEAPGSSGQRISGLPESSETSQDLSGAHERSGEEGNANNNNDTTSRALNENQQRSALNDNTHIANLQREMKKLRVRQKKTKRLEDKFATLEVRLSASESREKAMSDRLDAITQERDDVEQQHQTLWNECFFFKAVQLDRTNTALEAVLVLFRDLALLEGQAEKLSTEHKELKKENSGLGKNLQTMLEFAMKSKNATVLHRVANESAMAHIKKLEEKVEELETQMRKQETLVKQEEFEKRRSAMDSVQ
ncbi:hypothetical protein J4E93_005145 [Alternaria ventricosa]|uniref:uncharacterized protein n=1 Tax=Alternaria ventricosa TaxID=1187951 RepID=UPI0020C3AB8D|nr:uncharacterized protein J4E93_005145 [Alternaria ventricosa]KAI4646921.1 hypothetical protein J4E93_005145 [Alternaria ventricosa]